MLMPLYTIPSSYVTTNRLFASKVFNCCIQNLNLNEIFAAKKQQRIIIDFRKARERERESLLFVVCSLNTRLNVTC